SRIPEQRPCIVRVFIAAENPAGFQRDAGLVKKRFHGYDFPVTVLAQSPPDPHLVMIEAGSVDSGMACVRYAQYGTVKTCELSVKNGSELWVAGISGDLQGKNTAENGELAFRKLQSALLRQGYHLDHLVRQWNYVGQIFGFVRLNDQLRQNYQLFNEVRGEYYTRAGMTSGFPAATGIGTDFNGVTLEGLAVKGDETLKIIPIGNPQQLHAYQYGQTVLKGNPPKQRATNQTPLFERAKLVTDGQHSRVFVSGTASIVGQETIGINDVKKQTWTTIGNIESLTSADNLKAHYPELMIIPDQYTYVRVYVKYQQDIPEVRRICQSHFGDVPMSFLRADICRDNLLMEIEAEKVSCRKHQAGINFFTTRYL
ncbi:MAG: hypothetical protein AB7D05_05840, partial [Mangrovibacterium sp.]